MVASLLFPDTGTRLAIFPTGVAAANKQAIVYSDAAGTVLAEIYADNGGIPGALISNATITTDSNGRLPNFWGPAAGTDRLYISVNAGPVVIVDADYNARIDSVEDGVFNAATVTGVDKTGATDSAAALQTAIDASPYGARWCLPPGIYRFDTTLTINRGRSLVGQGYYHLRDVSGESVYGDSGWLTSTYFGGTIIRSTLTSGPTIFVSANGSNNVMTGYQLRDFMMIGPGTGTGTAIQMGQSTPALQAIIRPAVSNVKIGNFSLGMQLQHVNEAIIDVAFVACTKAVSAVTDVNNITWTGLNMQRCGTGFVFEDATCVVNQFNAPIAQNITGTSFAIQGEDHIVVAPYFENTPTCIAFTNASMCAVHNPTVQGAGIKTMTIASGCNYNTFWGLKTNASAFTITNSGIGNSFHGTLVGLTDSGSNTWLYDTNNGIFKPPKLGSSTTTGPTMQYGSAFGWRFGATGTQGWQGTGSPEGVITAPVASIYHRTDGGAGTAFYVKESGSGNTGWVAK